MRITVFMRFNCTFMELKYEMEEREGHTLLVLIVPLWN